jgi:hypothetical protein
VIDPETFENLAEDRLNRNSPDARYSRYEILNLSMGGLDIIQKVMQIERIGLDFSPDAVIIAVSSLEDRFLIEHLSTALRENRLPPYLQLAELLRQANVSAGNSDAVIRKRLRHWTARLIGWTFRQFAEDCSRRGIRAFLLYRPSADSGAGSDPAARAEFARLAAEARIDVLDLSPAFDTVADRTTLIRAEWDTHTNALGHRLLADKLYEELLSHLFRREARPE